MTVDYRPEPPLPVVADEPPWLAAYGDDRQLIVYRSFSTLETDPMYLPVREHIKRHRMVLIDRETRPDPAMMFGQSEVSWFAVPQMRMGLLAGGMGELPR